MAKTFAFLRDYFSAQGLELIAHTGRQPTGGGYTLTNGVKSERFRNLREVNERAKGTRANVLTDMAMFFGSLEESAVEEKEEAGRKGGEASSPMCCGEGFHVYLLPGFDRPLTVGLGEQERSFETFIAEQTAKGKKEKVGPFFDCGFTYYAASFGPRYGEGSGVYVSLVVGAAEEAAEKGMEWEKEELPGYCEDPDCKGDCSFCDPDLCLWGESSYRGKDLFTAQELRENRRALLAGEVVYLSR
jgi:hypothetical protein